MRRYKPVLCKTLVEIVKDNQVDLISKYKFNSKTSSYEELSSTGFVLHSVTKSQYEDLCRREQASGQEAIVCAFGEMAFYDKKENPLKIGDRVLVTRNSGHNIVDHMGTGKVHRLIMDEDVMSIIEEVEDHDYK